MRPLQSQEGWACDQAGQIILSPWVQGGHVTQLGPSNFSRTDTSAKRKKESLSLGDIYYRSYKKACIFAFKWRA